MANDQQKKHAERSPYAPATQGELYFGFLNNLGFPYTGLRRAAIRRAFVATSAFVWGLVPRNARLRGEMRRHAVGEPTRKGRGLTVPFVPDSGTEDNTLGRLLNAGPVALADRASRTAFRGIKSLQPARRQEYNGRDR